MEKISSVHSKEFIASIKKKLKVENDKLLKKVIKKSDPKLRPLTSQKINSLIELYENRIYEYNRRVKSVTVDKRSFNGTFKMFSGAVANQYYDTHIIGNAWAFLMAGFYSITTACTKDIIAKYRKTKNNEVKKDYVKYLSTEELEFLNSMIIKSIDIEQIPAKAVNKITMYNQLYSFGQSAAQAFKESFGKLPIDYPLEDTSIDTIEKVLINLKSLKYKFEPSNQPLLTEKELIDDYNEEFYNKQVDLQVLGQEGIDKLSKKFVNKNQLSPEQYCWNFDNTNKNDEMGNK